ncbi:hypothetical protein AHAS_Ahas03G0064400 [Arachis hypogaea]
MAPNAPAGNREPGSVPWQGPGPSTCPRPKTEARCPSLTRISNLRCGGALNNDSVTESPPRQSAIEAAQLISSIAQPAVGDGEDRSVSCSASKVALTLLSPDHRVHHCRRNLHLLPSFPSLKLFPRRPEVRFLFLNKILRSKSKMGGGHGEGTTYKGITIHQPKRWHTVAGKGLCAVMWFWVFYRAKQDGPVVLGWRHPWEGHDDHGHGGGH